jgi:hypothetical protein
MKTLSSIFYLISVIFMGLGFHKLYKYENYDSEILDSVNAYVGGDAYNYIINTGYATSFFIIATLFTILASFILLMDKLSQKDLQQLSDQQESTQQTNTDDLKQSNINTSTGVTEA